jgi:hypothetical protein
LNLPPGTHRFKFIVDDEWRCSNDLDSAPDDAGNMVNYLEVLSADDEALLEGLSLSQCIVPLNQIPQLVVLSMKRRLSLHVTTGRVHEQSAHVTGTC